MSEEYNLLPGVLILLAVIILKDGRAFRYEGKTIYVTAYGDKETNSLTITLPQQLFFLKVGMGH